MTPLMAEQVSVVETEYGMVLLDERTGEYWQLTPSASTIVARLRDGGGVEEAVVALTRAFDVNEETARRDTLALVERLVQLQVMTR
ncbi:lasso peptide biosynthesis PqqD family chaperone [Streptomyces leeuwenhoekii]|uniref:Lasso peptide biosynthesis PqqD family chaperone n=1 Tax=Streptomyces leeuwenhoekii TaxID=1437453 RepID=A0A0F7VNU6_STRLW|nr:lasso peptide biosynthesis PqqD family chaperone [Streptomyces leeuwenhoekii]CQR60043.1 Conserved Hypothetical Protein [Streptomyces leeuwenhoekii]